jgi:hypothetical protein
MSAAARPRFQRDHSAAAKFNVVWMCAKGQKRHHVIRGFRYGLHRIDQWDRGMKT